MVARGRTERSRAKRRLLGAELNVVELEMVARGWAALRGARDEDGCPSGNGLRIAFCWVSFG